jgi:CDP-diacylglycerol---glycerol-3-phosphate 3-phosphatidyltransferase
MAMLNRYARAFFTAVLTPVARFLLRAGVSPDVVTFVGTLGVCAGALAFYPRGELLVGTLVITAFVFSDLVDGTMARLGGGSSRWGAFLDSTLDRLGDAAIFGGLTLYFANKDDDIMTAVTLCCLALGSVVPYARARAEGLGMTASVGIAERADRLVVALIATGLAGFGVPYVHPAALWMLAIASAVTLIQRIVVVRRQAIGGAATPAPGSAAPGSAAPGSAAPGAEGAAERPDGGARS